MKCKHGVDGMEYCTNSKEDIHKLAVEHWAFIEKVLINSQTNINHNMLDTIGFFYIESFMHGYKHAKDENPINPHIDEKELNELKEGILKLLNKKDGLYISDLAEKLHTEPRKIVYAVRKLKEEGLMV